MPEENLFSW